MNAITLPTCAILRAINNDILADVLYYFSSYHGQQILNIVAEQLNKAYNAFRKAHPYFDGQINLIGHSLGGVICYDLLSNMHPAKPPCGSAPESKSAAPSQPHFVISYPQLDFRPNALFCLGSPIGAVLVMRGQSLAVYRPPKDILFHNVFHLYDPLGYRVEPLLDSQYATIPPILLQRPSAKNSNFAYYRQLISSYLPELPSMTSMSQLPMPSLPLGMSMTMPNLQLPPLDSLRGHMAGVMESMYASVWTGGLDEEEVSEEDAARTAAADDAKDGWIPRKKQRVEEMSDSTQYLTNSAGHALSRSASLPPDFDTSTSHKRKRRAGRSSSEHEHIDSPARRSQRKIRLPVSRKTAQDSPSLTTGHVETIASAGANGSSIAVQTVQSSSPPASPIAIANTIKPALSYVSTLTGGVSESVSSMADMMYKSFMKNLSGTTNRNPTDQLDDNKNVHEPPEASSKSATSTFVDELVGREQLAEMVGHDAAGPPPAGPPEFVSSDPETASTKRAASSTAPTASQSPQPAPITPPRRRLDYYVQDNIIDNVFQQYLIGMKAHFSYWSNKNAMHHMVWWTLQRGAGHHDDAGHW
ncbi:hypothetical protein PhCBS80983_g01796 [Powellomyces hirtus]|uniref:DDHD domain-containing protein n=1 Tax=Powellomyces hirtus TaxID=109895 RepID=A0A507EAQ6_9FUNG|nr:hypothetical protein PhCBS80983_g01796 [Powellomyces hirtus]